MRAFGIADQFSIHLENPGHVVLTPSPGMTSHIRDAAYYVDEDPAADASWDAAALDLLAELGHALSDALDLLRVRERVREPSAPVALPSRCTLTIWHAARQTRG